MRICVHRFLREPRRTAPSFFHSSFFSQLQRAIAHYYHSSIFPFFSSFSVFFSSSFFFFLFFYLFLLLLFLLLFTYRVCWANMFRYIVKVYCAATRPTPQSYDPINGITRQTNLTSILPETETIFSFSYARLSFAHARVPPIWTFISRAIMCIRNAGFPLSLFRPLIIEA